MSKQLRFLPKPEFPEQIKEKSDPKINISGHFFHILNHLPKKDYFFAKESLLWN